MRAKDASLAVLTDEQDVTEIKIAAVAAVAADTVPNNKSRFDFTEMSSKLEWASR